MKRLYWLIQSLFNPVYNDECRRLGEGEYLASHGVASEKNDCIKTMQGLPVVKLSKHLQNIIK